MKRIIHQEFTVHYHYPVVFTHRMFDPANPSLRDVLHAGIQDHASPKLLTVVDAAVAAAFPDLADRVTAYVRHHAPLVEMPVAPLVVTAGEALKSNRSEIERLIRLIAQTRLDRHSFVMAIGGGALLDAVGYAASLVHRGVRMIRVPTTVLSQNDGGVGVKTAINDPAGKNFLGTFAPPFAVINDFTFLSSLSDEHWRSGIAEAFKVALIKDANFFDWLCAQAVALSNRDAAVMEELVCRCAELHLLHIRSSGDPFEMGQARPLDFGHWSAHQMELMSRYSIGHGSAVAIGIMLDALYAVRAGWLEPATADLLFAGLTRAGFDLWQDILGRRESSGRLELLAGLDRFREHLGGALCVTMPNGVGRSMEISSMDEQGIEACLTTLHERVAAISR